jgi:5-methylcytosine-specific restriction endonuclease McrA
VCNVRKAVVLLWLGKAELVEHREQSALRTITAVYPYPSIVRLFVYVRLPYRKVELSRKNIIRRDNHQCSYCNTRKTPLTIDHVIPKSRGGKDTWENLVTACVKCNNKKGNRTPDEAGMPLARKPFRPNHVTFLRKFAGRIEQEWEEYLFMR